MPRSESASASTQLGPQLAPSGPSEASPSAPSGGRAEREDAAAVGLRGRRQPLEPPFGAQRHPGHSVCATSVTVHDAHAFQNKWFKRTREIIRCSVSEREHRLTIEHDVFEGLPDVSCEKKFVASVLTYLDRVEELPLKYEPEPIAGYAKTVHMKLASELQDKDVTWWREQLRALLKKLPILEGKPEL